MYPPSINICPRSSPSSGQASPREAIFTYPFLPCERIPSITLNFLPISRASLTLRPIEPSSEASSTSDFSASVDWLNFDRWAGGRRRGRRERRARMERRRGWLVSGVEVEVEVCGGSVAVDEGVEVK